ncbi:beta-propeller domain-containing protein [Patescibacteria group bacterium]|nr:beta-propeller domain-containing protein [Patescibacteria group bacterium]
MFKYKTTIKSAVALFAIILVLSGCSLIPKPPKDVVGNKPILSTIQEKLANQSKIKKFADYDELKEFLQEHPVESYGNINYSRGDMWGGEEVMFDQEMGLGEATPSSMKSMVQETTAGSVDYSKTNIQVEGVDEADIIKTDGKYIYAVSKNNLFIVNAHPAENAEIFSKIEFKSRPSDIYINGDNLIIYGIDDQIQTTELYKKFVRRGNYVFFKVFDISDKKNPKQIRDLGFEGNYSNSRMIGDYVYFITTNNNYYTDNDSVLPMIIEDSKVVLNKCADKTAKCFAPDVYYFDMPYDLYNFTTIIAVNIKNNTQPIKGDVYLMASNQNMYVSQNNIYITYTKYISEQELATEVMKEIIYPLLSKADQDKIAKIEQTENFILSKNEKLFKISQIIERYKNSTLNQADQNELQKKLENAMKQKYEDISKELEKTIIHKIAINKDELEYKTFSEVPGQVLNQFSMDESNGYFRIATTKNRTWSQFAESNESYNNLYVLDVKDLKTVGKLEGLAKTEKIYSVRFMQNRAYMVTFRQTDPLFVIDLSNPTRPTVLGKLKIPGFSNYLHPYDNDTLIGIGKDATESGRQQGLKLSLFDVSDVANPKEIDNYVMGDRGSDSIALYDHKAFLFSKEKNLLVIPVSTREEVIFEDVIIEPNFGQIMPPLPPRRKEMSIFVGAAVFKVDKTGFKLTGKIDHSNGGQSSGQDYWRGYNYYDNTVKRSLYIDDILYTFSNNYLKANKLSDLELVKNIELKKEKSDDFEVVN